MDAIARAFLRSGSSTVVSAQSFRESWVAAGQDIRGGILPLDPAEYEDLDEIVRSRGYPAVRHSQGYRALLKPSYRVVLESETILAARTYPSSDEVV